jgi:hypothetical protein
MRNVSLWGAGGGRGSDIEQTKWNPPYPRSWPRPYPRRLTSTHPPSAVLCDSVAVPPVLPYPVSASCHPPTRAADPLWSAADPAGGTVRAAGSRGSPHRGGVLQHGGPAGVSLLSMCRFEATMTFPPTL